MKVAKTVLAVAIAGFVAVPTIGAAGWQDTFKNYGNMAGQQTEGSGLSTSNISMGLKEALSVGNERVVSLLGTAGSFNDNSGIHIPLPKTLGKLQSALKTIGMSQMADDVELKLNRAAEAAVPKAKKLFVGAIAAMTLEDVTGTNNGPTDSTTRYFQSKMSDPLANEMRPVIDGTLTEVGAIRYYDAMDGLFLYLGKEEAAIRENSAKRSTDLLKKVFGKT